MYKVPYSIEDLKYLTKEFLIRYYQGAVESPNYDYVQTILEEKLILIKNFLKEFDNSGNTLENLYETFISFLPEKSEITTIIVHTPLIQVPLLINTYKGYRAGFNELISIRLRIGK